MPEDIFADYKKADAARKKPKGKRGWKWKTGKYALIVGLPCAITFVAAANYGAHNPKSWPVGMAEGVIEYSGKGYHATADFFTETIPGWLAGDDDKKEKEKKDTNNTLDNLFNDTEFKYEDVFGENKKKDEEKLQMSLPKVNKY